MSHCARGVRSRVITITEKAGEVFFLNSVHLFWSMLPIIMTKSLPRVNIWYLMWTCCTHFESWCSFVLDSIFCCFCLCFIVNVCFKHSWIFIYMIPKLKVELYNCLAEQVPMCNLWLLLAKCDSLDANKTTPHVLCIELAQAELTLFFWVLFVWALNTIVCSVHVKLWLHAEPSLFWCWRILCINSSESHVILFQYYASYMLLFDYL